MENLCTNVNHTPASLIDEYSDSVYKFCRNLTYSKEDADDLFQETFLKVLESPNKINLSNNPQSFLFSTALFIWKAWKRKYARHKRIASIKKLDETICNTDNIEDGYMIQEENRIVREEVNSLPEKFKIPIILYYTSEFSVSDIAETLKLPIGTVKSRLFKARKLVEKGLLKYEK
jgi:RNA polymerase sigma factor, sigma-70 family